MKDFAPLAAAVGGRIHDKVPANQEFPYVRYGFPFSTPLRAACWSGESIRITIHVFSEAADSREASRIMGLIRRALDDTAPAYDDFDNVALLAWAQSQMLADGSAPNRYHGVVEFDAATAEVVD